MFRKLIFLLAFGPMTFLPLPIQSASVYAAAETDSKAAEAKIVGPTEGVPGDIIYLDFSESVASKLKCVVEPSRFSDGKATFRLDMPDAKLEPEAHAKGPRGLYLASRPFVYRISLLVSNETGPDLLVFTVTITSPTPVVPPTPPKPVDPVIPPPPPPINPLPAGRFGLAEFTRSQILSNVPTDKRGLCAAFSGNYAAVAAQIAAGTIRSLADANAKLKTMNQATAGATLEFWKTNVFAAVVAKQNALATSKVLNVSAMDDIQAALSEIATGFAAGAQ